MLQATKVLILLTLAFTIAGCGRNGETVTVRPLPGQKDHVELAEPTDNIGQLGFSSLDGWPSRPPKIGDGVVMFAPEDNAWKTMGFRPNLSVKIRENPGMNLDELKTILNDSLSKNVEQLNATLFVDAQPVLDSEGHSLTIADIKFDLLKSTLRDGYPCLESEALGAFELNGKIIHTKTLGVALLSRANMYTVTIIIPMSHEKELTQEWNRFKQTLRFRDEADGG